MKHSSLNLELSERQIERREFILKKKWKDAIRDFLSKKKRPVVEVEAKSFLKEKVGEISRDIVKAGLPSDQKYLISFVQDLIKFASELNLDEGGYTTNPIWRPNMDNYDDGWPNTMRR